MNKLILAISGASLLITSNAFAVGIGWADKPLNVQPAYAAPEMGEQQVQPQQSTVQQNTYASGLNLNNYSVSAGFSGSKIGSNELGGDAKFKGLFLEGAYDYQNNLNFWGQYSYQKYSDLEIKLNEISFGVGYKFLEQDNFYALSKIGVGYAWTDQSEYWDGLDTTVDSKFKYVTLPIELELGYRFTPNVSVFGGVGYKWLFNQDLKLCAEGECVSVNDSIIKDEFGIDKSDLDIDGYTYKLGLRYNF